MHANEVVRAFPTFAKQAFCTNRCTFPASATYALNLLPDTEQSDIKKTALRPKMEATLFNQGKLSDQESSVVVPPGKSQFGASRDPSPPSSPPSSSSHQTELCLLPKPQPYLAPGAYDLRERAQQCSNKACGINEPMNAAMPRVQRHIFKRLKEVMRVGTSGAGKRERANGKSCPELGRLGQEAHG